MEHRGRMNREDRAKQFMPFAALKGYPEALTKKRENRSTQNRTAGRVPGRAGSETSTD